MEVEVELACASYFEVVALASRFLCGVDLLVGFVGLDWGLNEFGVGCVEFGELEIDGSLKFYKIYRNDNIDPL